MKHMEKTSKHMNTCILIIKSALDSLESLEEIYGNEGIMFKKSRG